MILRRITQHVKEQNWFAVWLDFLIVVLGVFLGIQIGNWNETRLDQRAYEQAHARMVIEARNNIEDTQGTLSRILPLMKTFQLGIETVRECQDGEQALQRINAAVDMLHLTLETLFENSALTQLTTSERLLERQSTERREQYSQYAKYLRARMEWSEDTSEKMEARSDDLHPFLDYGPYGKPQLGEFWDNQFWDDDRTISLVVEPEVACQDDAFRKLLYRWESNNIYQIGLMRDVISKTKEYLAELGEEPITEEESR